MINRGFRELEPSVDGSGYVWRQLAVKKSKQSSKAGLGVFYTGSTIIPAGTVMFRILGPVFSQDQIEKMPFELSQYWQLQTNQKERFLLGSRQFMQHKHVGSRGLG